MLAQRARDQVVHRAVGRALLSPAAGWHLRRDVEPPLRDACHQRTILLPQEFEDRLQFIAVQHRHASCLDPASTCRSGPRFAARPGWSSSAAASAGRLAADGTAAVEDAASVTGASSATSAGGRLADSISGLLQRVPNGTGADDEESVARARRQRSVASARERATRAPPSPLRIRRLTGRPLQTVAAAWRCPAPADEDEEAAVDGDDAAGTSGVGLLDFLGLQIGRWPRSCCWCARSPPLTVVRQW